MEFLIPLLLFLTAFNASPTWATKVRTSQFKGIVCNQCQQWCQNTDLVTTEPMRPGKAGPQGPVGRPGGIGPPGRVGPVGPAGPEAEINMTLIDQIIDRKIKEALQMFNVSNRNGAELDPASSRNDSAAQIITRSSCDGAKMESALQRTDSGGVFNLIIPGVGARNVLCDLTEDGANWTVFQRRMNGDVDFYRGWDDYVNGFGDLQGDHWLGLEAMHQMTKDGNMEMKIKLIKKNGVYWVAKYSSFRIGPGSDFYRLHVSGYSGNATFDGLAWHNNRQFSTKDADHDDYSTEDSPNNCASRREGAWWYGDCAHCNLNGNFHITGYKGFWWYDGGNFNYLRFSEMKFRRRG